MVNRLVERYGKTGFAALSSVIWLLPMASWAGSSDLSPYDKTAYPWIALAVGLVMLGAWIGLLVRLGRIPVSSRPHRFDLRQMSSGEKRWTLGWFVFICGLLAELNAAATVDWAPLGSAISAGRAGPTLLAAGLGLYALVMIAGIWFTWGRASRAYRDRVSSSRPAAEPAPR